MGKITNHYHSLHRKHFYLVLLSMTQSTHASFRRRLHATARARGPSRAAGRRRRHRRRRPLGPLLRRLELAATEACCRRLVRARRHRTWGLPPPSRGACRHRSWGSPPPQARVHLHRRPSGLPATTESSSVSHGAAQRTGLRHPGARPATATEALTVDRVAPPSSAATPAPSMGPRATHKRS